MGIGYESFRGSIRTPSGYIGVVSVRKDTRKKALYPYTPLPRRGKGYRVIPYEKSLPIPLRDTTPYLLPKSLRVPDFPRTKRYEKSI